MKSTLFYLWAVMFPVQSRGVAGAVVLLNGRQVALTDADGWYYLDSMKAGAYEMDVSAPRLQFTHTRVQITPNTPRLADALADRSVVASGASTSSVALKTTAGHVLVM